MSSSKQNFMKAHWDKLVFLVGVLSLGGVVALFSGSEDELAAVGAPTTAGKKNSGNASLVDKGMAALTNQLADVLSGVKDPPSLLNINEKEAKDKGNFLTSPHRVFCRQGDETSKEKACGRPIPAGSEVCPFCHIKQNVVKIEADSDHDGLPNTWEKLYGLNPNDASDAAKDLDKDGFTNEEEYAAKTDPKDPESHPDYLNDLATEGGIKEVMLPFWFNDYVPVGDSYRFTFQLTNARAKRSRYVTAKCTALLNEEIAYEKSERVGVKLVKTGWVVVKFEKRSEKRKLRGTGKENLETSDDASVVTLKRTTDGKTLTAKRGQSEVAIEKEAELVYKRGEPRKITVSVGTEFELNGSKYRVEALHSVSNGCSATILDLKTKKQKTIR